MNTYPKTYQAPRGQPQPPSFKEIVTGIIEALTKLEGKVSDLRQHAIDSQLRTLLRALGFRPRETAGTPLVPVELAKQLEASFNKLELEAPAGREQFIYSHAISVLTNLEGDLEFGGNQYAPNLPEAPAAT